MENRSKNLRQKRLKKSRGFTLIEALLAAAILGVAGYVLAESFNNGQMALLNWEDNDDVVQFKYWAIEQIDFDSLSLDELEEGNTIVSVDNLTMEWFGEAIPTDVIDVFTVNIQTTVSGSGGVYVEGLERRLVRNRNFYETDTIREQLLEDKELFYEALRKERERL